MDILQINQRLNQTLTDDEPQVSVDQGIIDEAAAEAVEERVELDEAISEQVVEMHHNTAMSLISEQLERTYAVISQRGCSRDLVHAFQLSSLYANTDIQIESFGAIGDPNDSNTLFTLEAIGERVKKIWEWIKNIFKKIIGFMGAVVKSIMIRVGSADKNIGRLRKEYQSRTADTKAAAKSDKKVYNPALLGKYKAALIEAGKFAANNEANIKKHIDALLDKAKKRAANAKKSNPINTMSSIQNDDSGAALDAMLKDFDALLKKCDDAKTKVKDDTIAIGRVGWGTVGGLLDQAMATNKVTSQWKGIIERGQLLAKQNSAEADRLSNVSLDGDMDKLVKDARQMATATQRAASMQGRVIGHAVNLEGMLIKMCHACISLGSKTSE